MDREYGGLKRAYGEMSFCWQETAAEEWHKRRLQHEDREKKVRLEKESAAGIGSGYFGSTRFDSGAGGICSGENAGGGGGGVRTGNAGTIFGDL